MLSWSASYYSSVFKYHHGRWNAVFFTTVLTYVTVSRYRNNAIHLRFNILTSVKWKITKPFSCICLIVFCVMKKWSCYSVVSSKKDSPAKLAAMISGTHTARWNTWSGAMGRSQDSIMKKRERIPQCDWALLACASCGVDAQFKCTICGKSFKYKCNLLCHCTKFHKS